MRVALGRDVFTARVVDGELAALDRGDAGVPDATVTCAVDTMQAVRAGTLDVDSTLACGELMIDGDAGTARRFLSCVPIPDGGRP